MLRGVALIEVGELLPNNALIARVANTDVAFTKRGLYRLDATAATLRVYQGRVELKSDAKTVTAKKGHEISLNGIETGSEIADTKFNLKQSDPFYDWSASRANTIASANLISARVANNSSGNQGSAWAWNPAFGLFTFLPASGYYNSPFGPTFYSPAALIYYVPLRGGTVSSGVPASSSTASGRGGMRGPSARPLGGLRR